MTPDWRPNRAWVEKLTSDPDQLYAAIETWELAARCFHAAAQRFDPDEKPTKPDGESTGPATQNLVASDSEFIVVEVPKDTPYSRFCDLTDLIVSWCDVSAISIDPSPIAEFKINLMAISPMHAFLEPPDISRLSKLFGTCMDLLRRIRFVVKHDFKPTCDEVDAAKRNWKQFVFDISIDSRARLIRRQGYCETVSLESAPCSWSVFMCLLDAAPDATELETMEARYPGDWSPDTRNQIYRELRTKLSPLFLTVERRTLKPISNVE